MRFMTALVINVIETKQIHGHRTTGRPASYRSPNADHVEGMSSPGPVSLDAMRGSRREVRVDARAEFQYAPIAAKCLSLLPFGRTEEVGRPCPTPYNGTRRRGG